MDLLSLSKQHWRVNTWKCCDVEKCRTTHPKTGLNVGEIELLDEIGFGFFVFPVRVGMQNPGILKVHYQTPVLAVSSNGLLQEHICLSFCPSFQ